MIRQGHYIAKRNMGSGYFGDYYVLASKRSQFHYVALSDLKTFALTKRFMKENIFQKYPELERIMIGESFARYVTTVRKPCTQVRVEKIKQLNQKMLYSQISAESGSKDPIKQMKRMLSDHRDHRAHAKKETGVHQNRIVYKTLLDEFNQKTRLMHKKSQMLNNLFKELILDLDNSVLETEGIFKEKVQTFIDEQAQLQRKYY